MLLLSKVPTLALALVCIFGSAAELVAQTPPAPPKPINGLVQLWFPELVSHTPGDAAKPARELLTVTFTSDVTGESFTITCVSWDKDGSVLAFNDDGKTYAWSAGTKKYRATDMSNGDVYTYGFRKKEEFGYTYTKYKNGVEIDSGGS